MFVALEKSVSRAQCVCVCMYVCVLCVCSWIVRVIRLDFEERVFVGYAGDRCSMENGIKKKWLRNYLNCLICLGLFCESNKIIRAIEKENFNQVEPILSPFPRRYSYSSSIPFN